MCVHLREVRTNYNQVQVKDEDFVDIEDQRPTNRSSKKRRRATNGDRKVKKIL